MRKLTKKLLITTSTILGLLTIGVGTSIALSSCAKKELKLENFSEWSTKDKINVLTDIKTKLKDQKTFDIKTLEELIKFKKEDLLNYKNNVSNVLFKWLNNEKTNPNKLITKLVYNDLKLKVKNKEDFTKKVDPLIKDIEFPINNVLMPDTTIRVKEDLNKLIDLYINLYKSL